MSSRATNYRVGIFVLAGLALTVAFVLVLGGTTLFSRPRVFETYFDESIGGLAIGSPVKLRGVSVGRVAEIGFADDYYEMPPGREVELGRLVVVRMETTGSQQDQSPDEWRRAEEFLERQIEQGLRLHLNSSPLTGITFVEGDYTSPGEHPPLAPPWTPDFTYIPSTPSTLKALVTRLRDIDFESVMRNADALIVEVRNAVAALDTKGMNARFLALMDEVRGTNARLQRIVDGNRYEVEVALENLRIATENLRDVSETARQYPSYLILGEPPERSKEVK
jgi:paraquat-inducible protein B